MERTCHKKFQTPEKWEAGAIIYDTSEEPELFHARGQVEFAFEDTPRVRAAAEKYRRGMMVDAYRFAMVMKKLTGRLIEAKQVLKQDMGINGSFYTSS